MCTVTLSYNQNDAVARQALIALLGTGRFTQVDTREESVTESKSNGGYDEQAFNEILLCARQRIEQKKFYTPDEAIDVIFQGVKDVYEMKDDVQL